MKRPKGDRVKQEDRLLEDVEIRALQRGMPLRSTDFNTMKRCLKAQDTKSYAQALKDVGEWLDSDLQKVWMETGSPKVEFGESQWRLFAERMYRLQSMVAKAVVSLGKGELPE